MEEMKPTPFRIHVLMWVASFCFTAGMFTIGMGVADSYIALQGEVWLESLHFGALSVPWWILLDMAAGILFVARWLIRTEVVLGNWRLAFRRRLESVP